MAITQEQLDRVIAIANKATDAGEFAKGILEGEYDNYDGADGAREVAELCIDISALVTIINGMTE